MTVTVREATEADWPAVWSIIQEIAGAGETFAMEAAPTEHEMRTEWMTRSPGRVIVATDDRGAVLGTANMYANRPNQGAHVASGSFMVAIAARGRGLGRAMVRDMITWAGAHRFLGIQFNAVVATNAAAVRLYKSEGFRVVGTAPKAFRHPTLGLVDLLIMWRGLP
ncbi:MAG: GNAT family N-acetyltransferase [Nocardioidaceae bacterium]